MGHGTVPMRQIADRVQNLAQIHLELAPAAPVRAGMARCAPILHHSHPSGGAAAKTQPNACGVPSSIFRLCGRRATLSRFHATFSNGLSAPKEAKVNRPGFSGGLEALGDELMEAEEKRKSLVWYG